MMQNGQKKSDMKSAVISRAKNKTFKEPRQVDIAKAETQNKYENYILES